MWLWPAPADYLAGLKDGREIWRGQENAAGAANLVAYQREVAERDLSLTHAIVHPTLNRRVPNVAGENGAVALHKVEDTEHGVLVRGARVLATLAPFADELFVYPGEPIANDARAHALAFAIPMSTPGLKFLCRDSYSIESSYFDHPFSRAFDEQDACVIFDDVEVPRRRVFIDGDPDTYNRALTGGWVANVMQQTTIRARVKLEFAYELATRMVQAVGGENPGTLEMLGELWTYAELTRAALCAAEAGAHPWGDGVWFCDDRPFVALCPTLPKWFARVNEVIKLLGAHNLLATPTQAQFADAELRPLLDRYLRGADSVDAVERARLFRAASDFAGSALGSRVELYERFYLASSSRTYQLAHLAAQKEGGRRLLDRVPAHEEAT